MNRSIYLIETRENYRWGWRFVGYTVVGYKSIYYVENSKIYLAKFKRVIPSSMIDKKCVGVYYQDRLTVKKCDPRVMNVILKNAKEIKQVSEDDQFLYKFLEVISEA